VVDDLSIPNFLDRTGATPATDKPDPTLTDVDLINKINTAVIEANKAEKELESTRNVVVSTGKVVGELLLELKKRHPKVVEFEGILKNRVQGLTSLSRAYDLMKLAGGRITDQQLRDEAAARKRKSREKKKSSLPPKPTAIPKPTEPKVSVTIPHVTESQAAEPKPSVTSPPVMESGQEENAGFDYDATESGKYLDQFKAAANALLAKMDLVDRADAAAYVVALVKQLRHQDKVKRRAA
jgi:hypothetical protein